MRKVLFLSLLLSLILAGNADAAETKIGVFNSRAIAANCAPLKDAQKKLESQFANERNALEKQSQELKRQADQIQTQQAGMNPDAREDALVKFQRQKRDFEDRYQAFARKAENAAARLEEEFVNNLMTAAQDYGNRKGYNILLDSAIGGPVFYTKDADVTNDMITEVTRVYKEKPAGSR